MVILLSATGVYGISLLAVGIIVAAIAAGELCKRIGLAPVFGQILFGTLVAGFFSGSSMVLDEHAVSVIANIGINLLMFKIGLETNPHEMLKVGVRSLVIAVIGVVVPFVFGAYVIGPWLFPGASKLAHVFIGAALTATSVSIPVDILSSFGKANSRLGRTVTGAAVIDDILGLLILAVVQAAATGNSGQSFTDSGALWIMLISIGFVVGSIVVGMKFHVSVGRLFAKISSGENMKIAFALGIGFSLAALASKVGLAEFVGAYCAGLFLTEVAFKDFAVPRFTEELEHVLAQEKVELNGKFIELKKTMVEKHVEEILMSFIAIATPVFFVTSGMKLDMWVLFKKESLFAILICSVLACAGKVVAGLAAVKGERLAVGISMIPRGEVGLIFAAIGQQVGVMTPEIFSMVMGTILVSTLITPLLLGRVLKRQVSLEMQKAPA